MYLKFKKCEFTIIVKDLKTEELALACRTGYQVTGTPFDEIFTLVVHRGVYDLWVVSCLQNGHSLSKMGHKTRIDAVVDVVEQLKKVKPEALKSKLQKYRQFYEEFIMENIK